MRTQKEIGMIIQSARMKKGYTQEQFGEMLDCGKDAGSTVRKWENGKYYPNITKIREIARVLGLTLDDLVP